MTKYIIRVFQCILCNNVHKIMIAIIKSSTQKRSIIFAAANTLKVLWPLVVIRRPPRKAHVQTRLRLILMNKPLIIFSLSFFVSSFLSSTLVYSWEVAGRLHHPGGVWQQLHVHELKRQPLLPCCITWLRSGRSGGVCLHSGNTHTHTDTDTQIRVDLRQ